jgi:ATP-binding protein involved in chromosome partitioning
MVREIRVEDGALRFDLVFGPDHGREDRRSIERQLDEQLRAAGWTGAVMAFPRLERVAPPKPASEPVRGMSGPGMQPHGGPVEKQRVEGVRHIVAVASGKGGVGKSTIATNLATGLVKLGYKAGLLDADVYGPSLPTMMHVQSRPLVDSDKRILPVMAYGVPCLSMGFLVDAHEAIIWRGPMVMNLVRQFLQQARWGDLDVLVVDLPPGTGDAQLTLIQAVDIAGAVVVTTPQDVALADAIRGLSMFHKLSVPLLGVVENMAWYELPDGTRDYVFGEGGGVRVAADHGTKVLAQIPLQTRLRASGDDGRPAVLGDGPLADRLLEVARQVAEALHL